jgi:hypothetical protein
MNRLHLLWRTGFRAAALCCGLLLAVSAARAADADSIRLLHFCYNTDRILEQKPGESDTDFAARCRASSATGTGGIDAAAQRERIRKAWPTTQKAESLRMLRDILEQLDSELREYERKHANFGGNTMTDMIARQTYQRCIDLTQNRINVVKTAIRQVDR